MKILNIQKKNIINFDETEIQIECMKDQKILIPSDIKEFHAVSLTNKKNIIVFEMINTAEHYSLFFFNNYSKSRTYDIMVLRKTASGHSYFDLK